MNTETYTYDALNRLDYSSRTNGPAIDYDYDAIGNLLKKDDFATSYDYAGGSTGGPSAVKSVALIGGGSVGYCYDANGNRIGEAAGGSCSPGSNQNIWYNAFNKPLHISRNGTDLYFSYGADQKRYRQINQTSGKTTVYIDKLFERISGGGDTRYRHYIDDIAVVTNTSGASGTSYAVGFTHCDRLGSTVAIGDESGNLKETHSFDPFGKPRQGNILDKAVPTLESSFTTRGFTDHEHLDDVELIHMNGRAYDYNLGRFLSVDPVVQAPGNSQSLNPYSYIMNNPLAGTDPSGYTGCAASRLASICGNLPTANWGGSVTDMARKNHAVSAQGNGFNNQAINNALSKAKIPGAASEKLSLGARENVQQVKDASGQSGDSADPIKGDSAFMLASNDNEVVMRAAISSEKRQESLRVAQEGSGFWDNPGAHLWSPSQGVVDAATGFGDGVFWAITLGNVFGYGASFSEIREFIGAGGGDQGSALYQGSFVAGAATGTIATAGALNNKFRFVTTDAPHKGLGPHLHYGPKWPGSQHPRYHFGPRNPNFGKGGFNWKDWWNNGRPWRWK
ncbi:RHS repeat-associated core domain-containing protein [Microbulbifer sp. SAOS-129_SWC]|uniref:RHS repeat domain-containing protein n=1 Tax=Microbulbifer sp. SAOS-129_SWC TaxID=3145235 RepID=UPI00321666DB